MFVYLFFVSGATAPNGQGPPLSRVNAHGKIISTGVTGLVFTTVLFPVTTQHTLGDKKC
jgi:hypothetical protein